MRLLRHRDYRIDYRDNWKTCSKSMIGFTTSLSVISVIDSITERLVVNQW